MRRSERRRARSSHSAISSSTRVPRGRGFFRGSGRTGSNAVFTVRTPTPYSRIKARYDIPARASRRIAAYESTLDFGGAIAASSRRARPCSHHKPPGPAPLVSIVILTVITVAAGIAVPTVGDKGALPSSLPVPGLPDVPFTLDTLTTIAPYAFAMALVGLMESLMTAKLVDDSTDTHSNKTRESIGQDIANIITGFFGGMGGCAMIGQTMINVKVSGARTRLSTVLAGSFLMVLCIAFGPVVSDIPMAALVAVMSMVSFATFDWHSIAPKTLKRMPAGEIAVMVITVAAVVATHNLAVGVVVGSLTAMVIFAKRVAHLAQVTAVVDPDGSTVVYRVTGELFFASSNDLDGQFDCASDPDKVVIDLFAAHIWDASSVAALDAIETKYEQRGETVEITGLNDPSADLHGKLTGELAGSH
ncbi:SulP family inorganic anion transporter [Streptomyces mutabilis]|uniref:SulP family inorganic anion transporter n=1 Tax=Streptomyces mutabilis TaxID=67332 RepID=UPI000AE920EF